MLELKTHAPISISNHTDMANTIMNVSICPLVILETSISLDVDITLANPCFEPPGIAAAMLDNVDTNDVAIFDR